MTATAMMAIETLPGSHFPLGATVLPTGTNFAVASGAADGMILCLFDRAGTETQIPGSAGRRTCTHARAAARPHR
jgi:pullulanase/glycogen debranching enzyme